MLKIVVDSTSDMPPDVQAAYGITVVPLMIEFGNESLRDNVDISRDRFYERLVASDTIPKTSSPSVGAFEEVFRSLSADGSEVLSISLSVRLSSTLTAAQQAAKLVEGARIACVDSRVAAMPMTSMAIAAAEAARAGQTFEQIVSMVEAMAKRTVVYLAMDTLRYLEKGGRIGRVRAMLGTLLSVKPIIEVRDGEACPVEQVRTWKRVPGRMIELARSRGEYESFNTQFSTHRENAEALADLCAEAGIMPRERIAVVQTGGVIGTHLGPGALAITGILKA